MCKLHEFRSSSSIYLCMTCAKEIQLQNEFVFGDLKFSQMYMTQKMLVVFFAEMSFKSCRLNNFFKFEHPTSFGKTC
jgi:hypothetical protein